MKVIKSQNLKLISLLLMLMMICIRQVWSQPSEDKSKSEESYRVFNEILQEDYVEGRDDKYRDDYVKRVREMMGVGPGQELKLVPDEVAKQAYRQQLRDGIFKNGEKVSNNLLIKKNVPVDTVTATMYDLGYPYILHRSLDFRERGDSPVWWSWWGVGHGTLELVYSTKTRQIVSMNYIVTFSNGDRLSDRVHQKFSVESFDTVTGKLVIQTKTEVHPDDWERVGAKVIPVPSKN